MLAGAAVEPLRGLGDDIAPGFDVRKDPGEEEAEPGDVVGVRMGDGAMVGIAGGPGDVIVGPGGPEGLGREVEDTVVEGEEVVVGVEAIEEGEGGVEVESGDLGADRVPEAAISQAPGDGSGDGNSGWWIGVLVLLVGGPLFLGVLGSLFEEGNELGGEEILDRGRVVELHPLDAVEMVVIVALIDAEPDVGVWEEGSEDLGDADVATLLENTLEDGVLGAALSEDGVGVGAVGACSATQPVFGRRLRVGREGGPLGGGDGGVILVGEPAPVVPQAFRVKPTPSQLLYSSARCGLSMYRQARTSGSMPASRRA